MYEKIGNVLKNAEHYTALGKTDIYLDSKDEDLPWGDVVRIESGGGYRLNGPTGFYAIAEKNGLTLRWSVDFEGRDSNGKGYSHFDRDRLRMTMQRLPAVARRELAKFLEREVLPGVQKISAEYREYLNRQLDSEDCVRGLIAFARSA